MQKLEIKFLKKIKNTKPSLSPLPSHFGQGQRWLCNRFSMEEKGFQIASVGLHWEASPNHAPTSDTDPGNHGHLAFLTLLLIAQRFHYCVGYPEFLHEKRLFLPLKWLFQYWFRFEIVCWFMFGC
jgi:hypothetical protein